MGERHRVRLDVLGDHELEAGEADAVDRQSPPAQRAARVREVEHDLGGGRGELAEVGDLAAEAQGARVDPADLALGAREGDHLALAQAERRVPSPDDGRDAELSADDRGVTGAAAVVGDDPRGLAHDRHPVGVGDLGDEDRAWAEVGDVLGLADHTDLAVDDRAADAPPLDGRQGPVFEDIIDQLGAALALRLHSLGAGLDYVELPCAPVEGPLDVHRRVLAGARGVVALDRRAPCGEGEHVVVAEGEAVALGARRRQVAGRPPRAAGEDEGLLLGAELAVDDRPSTFAEHRRVDEELVGVDLALDHVLAEPPGGVDQDDVGKAGLGVEGEHHPGGAAIGADHLLDADREGDLEVVEAVELAVGDRSIGEEGGEAGLAGPQ